MGKEFEIAGNDRKRVDTSFLPGQTKIDTNNLNLDTSGLRPLSYTVRPYTGVTLNYQSMMPQLSRVNINNLNLDTSRLKPVKPTFTPELVRQAGLANTKIELLERNKPFSFNRRMYGYKYDRNGKFIRGDEVSEYADDKNYKLGPAFHINPEDRTMNTGFMVQNPEITAKLLNNEQLSSSDIYNMQNSKYLSDDVKNNYLPKGNWNMDNTRAYLDSTGMNYGSNDYEREKNIEKTMYQLNNPNLKNSFNEASWNKFQSGANLFLTNYDAVQAFKNRAANGTAFGRRSTSTNLGL